MPRKLIFLLPAALFVALLAAFAAGLRHDPHLLPSALIDRPVPDFSLPTLYEGADGLTRKDLEGRVTLVNFFASWCAPCREEHPQLMALAHRQGVTLDGIAYKDKPEESRRFLDRLGNPYSHIGIDSDGLAKLRESASTITLSPQGDTQQIVCSGKLRIQLDSAAKISRGAR